MTTMPPGPWVLVIGCHRSGTSAVTAALVALGLHGVDPADRMDRVTSNPEHWESMAASQFNEDLLASLGAAWDAPPAADAESPLPDPVSGAEDPARIMAQAYPEPGPVVWKDPRACLLLPFWRAALPGPLAVIFVWREPLAVARSLHRRDGIPLADGLALWEHYNRCAAVGLQGVDTFVLDYSSVVDDPEKVVVHVTHPTAEKEPEVAAAEAAPEITEPEVLKKGKAATEEEGEEPEKEKKEKEK